jgi:hypothetical protein
MWLLLKPVLGILRAIPWWAYVIALCLAWGGYQRWRATSTAKAFQQAQAEAAAEREKALTESLETYSIRVEAQRKAIDDAEKQSNKARTDAAAAGAAAGRLRVQLAAIKAGASAPHSAAASASQTAGLADLLAQCADRYRSVAEVADRSIIAGLTCQASYQTLMSTTQPKAAQP